MPTITLNKKDILDMLGKKVSDAELKDRISMIGTDLESIDDKEIVVEIFPNRPDMLTAAGFAKALSAFMGIKTGIKNYKINKSNYKVKVEKNIKKIRPYAVCAVVKNVELNELGIQYLMQVQEKLHKTFGRDRKKLSIGVYDLDEIEFPLTYGAEVRNLKFVPLEMDGEMDVDEILEKHPTGIDYSHLLDGFKKVPIWSDNNGKVLSMPPIINSENTKVTANSKNLFIDVTGLDLKSCEQALNILVTGFSERGADIYSVNVNGKNYPDLESRKVKLDVTYLNKILGLELKEKEIKSYFERMGYGFNKNIVEIPCYRTDVMSQIDLIEDIAIAHGYENFEEEISDFAGVAQEDKFESFRNTVCNIVTGFGFLETNTYNLAKKDDQTKNMRISSNLIEIENALNEEYNVLRSWMIPSLLDVLRGNKHYEYPQKIFEAGSVFLPEEKVRLGLLLTNTSASYTEARQMMDSLFNSLGVEGKVKSVKHDSFIPGRVGRVIVKGKEIGYVGEIHPAVLKNFDLDNPVVGFELNLSELFELI
ncbi:phenylalanine--tRNA ligase subunit beta [Candidatus Woesearchaeota archaeon]|mgnify:FL=1|jgi:phenylalanyl-tRNA synthetase beta chain|nr:phenylalanine--tRNA ligase subunit beta [Candidatus Woesearchaeota archaeon]MBT4835130.1 phenylalanine--tRNA ligase subunit beta [Candidatus Woesearchaeota archaeon]MBT6735065.1 phenylalanine--tRNA ligase subunit beta [Candidatus Woesearchaeota archaeon]MBT7170068.1 phenylalanine--tRNA ligase subunit beta [Candidatus Woesearchaeota archaeon]MBT7474837.1 phenylalanine--tRNA ligase subunit beta [Candidatus Woesearchaeota archaeon]